MSDVIVNKSADINQTDTIQYFGKELVFSLDEPNITENNLTLIYRYFLPSFPNHGYKVGRTVCKSNEIIWDAIKSRIEVQKHEVALGGNKLDASLGNQREVFFWGICLDSQSTPFKDYDVHKEIRKEYQGQKVTQNQEWFLNITPEQLIRAFNTLRKEHQRTIFTPRKEQKECIEALKGYFSHNHENGRFLLNCKRRFGKSFTAYKYCEEAGLNKILILTFVPAVESSWNDDLYHIRKNYRYLTDDNLKQPKFELKSIRDPFVVFLSLQNYLGKDKDNQVKQKIQKLQSVDWDLVILDEYHFGAWNSRTQNTFAQKEIREDIGDNYQKEIRKNPNILQRFKIKTKQTICLSGTPFKALAGGEFDQSSSFTYSYFDEQRNKYPNWEGIGTKERNPAYAQFPDRKILGYDMASIFPERRNEFLSKDTRIKKSYFSLNKFFRTEKDESSDAPSVFLYEKDVEKWLYLMKSGIGFGSGFPFLNPNFANEVAHTLWLMPTVSSCKARENLLKKDNLFSRYEIVNLSTEEAGTGQKAYNYLRTKISNSKEEGKLGTISLTVNKLTLGVTVKQWSGVFVLKDLASPEQYFQAIFRVQTPFEGKKVGYVFDFNIDRACALRLRYAKEESDGKRQEKLNFVQLIVKYLPIYRNGDRNTPIAEDVFYRLAELGDTSGRPLSKRITDTAITTRCYDPDRIAQRMADPETSQILKRVFAHTKFKKETKNTKIPDAQPSRQTEKARDGMKIGFEKGREDIQQFIDLNDDDSDAVQQKILDKIEDYLSVYNQKYEDPNDVTDFDNGFTNGYNNGINAPIKKMNCGNDDGIDFVKTIRSKFGENIQYTDDRKTDIKSFINCYLNDENHIPQKFRGPLFNKWYKKSFVQAAITELRPPKNDEKSMEQVDNIFKHILGRLFEFLYISVYRETKFIEIFDNADSDVFLEAVGITKNDFRVLNKYHVFQEKELDNCIHSFFVNESLGSTLSEEEKKKNKYRNSFDWFGYGNMD